MVTMEDISIELGCSINTVSKALNNKPDVSPKTRKLVLETARRLGYVPNALAKSLVTRNSGMLGIVVPSVTISIYAELVETIMKSAAEHNYSTFLALSSGNESTEMAAVESLYQKRVDGLIIVPTTSKPDYHDTLNIFKTPVVYVLNEIEHINADFVGVDLDSCAYQATQHLISKGCKKLALLCSTRTGMTWGIENGFLRCLEDNAVPHDADCIFKPNSLLHPQDAGYEIAHIMDDKINEYDGLILEHEQLYFGVNRLLEDHGLSCPKDILIAASIGMGVKKSPFLSLTSVEANPKEIGLDALKCLMDRMKDEESVSSIERKRCTLVQRKSSCR